MNRWLFALVLGAFASLTAARFVSTPAWIDFLWACFAFSALAFGVLVGILVRAKAPETWRSYASLALALAGGAGRLFALIHLSVDPHQRAAIDVTSMIAAASSLSWGILALLWGVAALAALFDAPGDTRLSWPRLTTAALGTVISLICIAPIGRLLGLRVDVWTLLGLFGLAVVAYLVDLSYARIRDRLEKRW